MSRMVQLQAQRQGVQSLRDKDAISARINLLQKNSPMQHCLCKRKFSN